MEPQGLVDPPGAEATTISEVQGLLEGALTQAGSGFFQAIRVHACARVCTYKYVHTSK